MKKTDNNLKLPAKHNGAQGITSREYKMALDTSDKSKVNYLTSNYMFNMGMCNCDQCGALCSIDTKWCNKCEQYIVIILTN